jgi:hypothetical protein
MVLKLLFHALKIINPLIGSYTVHESIAVVANVMMLNHHDDFNRFSSEDHNISVVENLFFLNINLL